MSLERFKRPVASVRLDDSVVTASRRMRDAKVGCVVVTREERPVGILTDRDIVLRVIAEGWDPATTIVSDVVTYHPFVVRESDGIETAVTHMKDHGVRRIPIVDTAGRATGIVTADDLMILLGREAHGLSEALEATSDAADAR